MTSTVEHPNAVGDMNTGFFGEIGTGPARSCGDIYATGVGDMHAGLLAGYMITGFADTSVEGVTRPWV